jgi:hypothetical protein
LRQNGYCYAEQRTGAARGGSALLAGLIVCGRCGHHMHVGYREPSGKVRYRCTALQVHYAGEPCHHLHGEPIERAVVEAFFAAVRPAQLDLLDDLLRTRRAERDRTLQQLSEQVKRAAYEAQLAERQYQKVDPDHRLVAAELERRWEQALRALAQARDTAERFAQQSPAPEVDPQVRAQLADLSTRLPEVWQGDRLTMAHKKELLRSLIERVIAKRLAPDVVEVRIVWVSGAVSEARVRSPIGRVADVSDYERLVERLLALSEEGYPDAAIAQMLTAEGFHAAHRADISAALVVKLRCRHERRSLLRRFTQQEKIDGYWTVYGLAAALGVKRWWIYPRIHNGTIPATCYRHSGCYVIEDDPELITRLRTLAASQQQKHRS